MIKIIMANLYEKLNTEKYSLYQMAIQRFLGSIFSNNIIGTELTYFWKLFDFNKKPSKNLKLKLVFLTQKIQLQKELKVKMDVVIGDLNLYQ